MVKNLIRNPFFMVALIAGILTFSSITAGAQCSVCTRTAAQLGEKPAKGLNAGILYLAATPLLLGGFIAYQWKKRNSNS